MLSFNGAGLKGVCLSTMLEFLENLKIVEFRSNFYVITCIRVDIRIALL